MRHLKSRGWPYKVGFVCLLVATLCLTLGVLCPGWIRHTTAGVTRYGGLFVTCRDGVTRCQTVDLERYPERLRATQCLEILGLTCLVLGSVFAVLDNVWPATKMTSGSARAQTLIPDILTLAGAASSFIGVMVYIGEYDVIVKTPGVSYGYSMVLSLLASLLAGGAAILIFIGNRMQPAGVQDGHVHPHTHDPDQLHFENQSSVVAQTAPRSARLPENGVQRPGSGTSDA